MRRLLPWSAAVMLALPALVRSESVSFEVLVDAGKHDRTDVPVCVEATRLPTLPGAKSVVLRDAAGKRVPAQVTRPGLLRATHVKPSGSEDSHYELHFLLPSLKAGATAAYQATVSTDAPAKDDGDAFSWHDTPGQSTDLRRGDRPVLRYMYEALDESSKEGRERTFKVYHHLFDPAGKQLVTKGPGGLFTHHRGIFYGFNRVTYGDGKTADVWHCTGDAHQSHERFLASEAGPVLGRHTVLIDWHGRKKEVFARETRELTVYNVPGGTLVEFASRLSDEAGHLTLDGDPQHAGFHFRAAEEVASRTAKQTYFLRPDGPGKPGETRNWDPKSKAGPVNLPWDAMSFVLGDRRYTVAYLDRPSNPKEARFSERDYGRFGSYFVRDVEAQGQPELGYRLWLKEGEMTVGQVAALDADFVEPVRAEVDKSRRDEALPRPGR